jgi:acylphosphatase
MDGSATRRRVVVHGRVQGVAFRAHTLRRAAQVGAAGWVCNRPDGSVEAVFEGPAAAVEAMLAFCRRGPSFARVERMDVVEEPAEGLAEFEIR